MAGADESLVGRLCELGPLDLTRLLRRHYTALKAVMRAVRKKRAWDSPELGYSSFAEYITYERVEIPLRVQGGDVVGRAEDEARNLGMQVAAERVIDFIGWDEPRPTVDEIREFVLTLRDETVDAEEGATK
jgi:hypothetical protein